MPENIESSLVWPESGLAGVPDAEGPLARTAPSHTRREDVEDADAKNGNGTHYQDDASATAVAPAEGAEQELTKLLETARAEGDSEAVREAEEALTRIHAATAEARATLEKVSNLISERDGRFTTQLDFGSSPLTQDHPGYFSQPLFGERADAFTPSDAINPAQASAVTWPPWGPSRARPLWSRIVRSNIGVPMLLIVLIGVAYSTYRIYHHVTRPTIVPAISATGITGDGPVKVINGPVCRAGHSTTTVQLASALAPNGSYNLGAGGTVSNTDATTLHRMYVHVIITYADGAQTTESVLANKGDEIPGKSTKSWYGTAEATDGSVPPVSVAITSVGTWTETPGLRLNSVVRERALP